MSSACIAGPGRCPRQLWRYIFAGRSAHLSARERSPFILLFRNTDTNHKPKVSVVISNVSRSIDKEFGHVNPTDDPQSAQRSSDPKSLAMPPSAGRHKKKVLTHLQYQGLRA